MESNKLLTTKEIVRISIFTVLIGLGAFISIPIGPVPITLQTLFVLLAAVVLGKKAAYAVLVYFLLGMLGLPIFAGGVSGIAKVFTPSFGFLLGMILAAYLTGSMFDSTRELTFIKALFFCLLASLLIYLVGLPYMAYILNVYLDKGLTLNQLLTNGMLLFIPGDIIKSVIAAFISVRLRKLKI